MKGQDLQFYLINLKSFKLEENNYRNITSGEVSLKQPRILKVQSVQQLITPSRCKMCHLFYKRKEMQKKLPMKMLFQVRYHLRKRGLFLFENLEVN